MTSAQPVKFTWTESERSLLGALVNPDCDVYAAVPKDPDPSELFENLSLVLRVHRYATRISGKLKPVIGRFLLLAKQFPESYRDQGFATYGAFVRDYCCDALGLSRSALYEAKMLAERLPDLTPQQVDDLGVTKTKILASFTRSGDPSFAGYLLEAQEHTATGLLKRCIERGLIENGADHPVCIVIQSNAAVHERWEEFSSRPETQAFVGSSSLGAILDAMIMECSASWFSEYAQKP